MFINDLYKYIILQIENLNLNFYFYFHLLYTSWVIQLNISGSINENRGAIFLFLFSLKLLGGDL